MVAANEQAGSGLWAVPRIFEGNTVAIIATGPSLLPADVSAVEAAGIPAIAVNNGYITSSPPYDIGDGEVGGFIFVLLNEAGDIVSHYAADAPPWAYNGPTNIRADKVCPVTRKKFRTVIAERTLEEIMDGAAILYRDEEITHEIKNRDMDLIPHPFGAIPPGHKVIMLDPMDDRVARLIELQNAGAHHLTEALAGKHIRVDNAECRRCGPPGVPIHRLKFKYSGQ